MVKLKPPLLLKITDNFRVPYKNLDIVFFNERGIIYWLTLAKVFWNIILLKHILGHIRTKAVKTKEVFKRKIS